MKKVRKMNSTTKETTAKEILIALKTGRIPRAKEAVKTLHKMLNVHYNENAGRKKGSETTDTLRFLRDEFLKMCEDSNHEICYAGLRGLRAIQISDIFEEKLDEMIDLFLGTIISENGRVRFATANIFDGVRPKGKKFTEKMYAYLFTAMQVMYEDETDPKKKKSIEQALDNLWSPRLEEYFKKYENVPKMDLEWGS